MASHQKKSGQKKSRERRRSGVTGAVDVRDRGGRKGLSTGGSGKRVGDRGGRKGLFSI
jgi:hypothetical protein